VWHNFLIKIPRHTRHTLGERIDNLFVEIIILANRGKYAKQTKKLEILKQISSEFDILKYLMTLLWEVKAIDHKKYARISKQLGSIGRMIGGWLKNLSGKNK